MSTRPGSVENHLLLKSQSSIAGLISKLNAEQFAASTAGRQPLLIVAGAGTGKTTTLVHRVAHHLQEGIHPSRIMLLTFTRRAAQQMLDRLRKHQGPDADWDIEGIWSGTFHSVSVRLLRIFGEAIGVPTRFTVHDRTDAEDLMGLLLDRLKKENPNHGLPKKSTALNIHSFQVNSQWHLKKVLLEQYQNTLISMNFSSSCTGNIMPIKRSWE